MSDIFRLFSLLPAEARVFVTLGDRGWWRDIGAGGRSPDDAAAAITGAVETLKRCGCASPGAVFYGDSLARVEFIAGDLASLTLTITSDHATERPWVFTGAFVDMGGGIYPPDGLRQLRAIAAFLATLEFQEERK